MIYVVNKRTKEHKALPDYFSQDASFYLESGVRWDIIRADADGWIPWEGGECPLPDGSVSDIRYRYPNGKEIHRVWPAEDADWREAVAYRPILNAYINPEEPSTESNETAPEPRRPFIDAGRMMGMVSKPEAPKWAIGDRCTWHLGDVCMGEHVILAKDGDTYWIRDDHGGYDMADREELRPIRTPAQRAEEEAVEAMARIIADGHDVYIGANEAADRLYHAFRDGKVPGVKLENNQ